jgi:hypothetical protein
LFYDFRRTDGESRDRGREAEKKVACGEEREGINLPMKREEKKKMGEIVSLYIQEDKMNNWVSLRFKLMITTTF